MNSIKLFFFILLSSFLYADVSIKQIDEELNQAEQDFSIAKKMFNPWYGGPLLTGSGNVMDPGTVNVQPYLYVTDNYAHYNGSGKSQSMTDFIVVNPVLSLGMGLINRVDTTINLQGIYQQQGSKSSGNIGDTSIGLGFNLCTEGPYIPAMKLSMQESFPTGKYNKLKQYKPGVDATGSGSFQTMFGYNISKVIWWWMTHPMQVRLSLNYCFCSKVKVKDYNAYGGGIGTNGKVNPGDYFSGSFGYELSCTQKAVLAIDVSYEYFNKTTFSGINGIDNGEEASNVNPSNDVLSLSPAIEYNFTPDISLIGGVWFSVWGRNTNNFISGIITFSYTF